MSLWAETVLDSDSPLPTNYLPGTALNSANYRRPISGCEHAEMLPIRKNQTGVLVSFTCSLDPTEGSFSDLVVTVMTSL